MQWPLAVTTVESRFGMGAQNCFMKNAGIYLSSSKLFQSVVPWTWKDLVHQDLFGFSCAKEHFNYVEVGTPHWSWKGTDLMDTHVNLGKY